MRDPFGTAVVRGEPSHAAILCLSPGPALVAKQLDVGDRHFLHHAYTLLVWNVECVGQGFRNGFPLLMFFVASFKIQPVMCTRVQGFEGKSGPFGGSSTAILPFFSETPTSSTLEESEAYPLPT